MQYHLVDEKSVCMCVLCVCVCLKQMYVEEEVPYFRLWCTQVT